MAEMLRTIAFSWVAAFSRVRPSCHLGATAFKRMHGRNIGTGCADLHPDLLSAPTEVSAVAIACRHPMFDGMSNAPQIAEVRLRCVGDPARANLLCELLGGRALTATELALAAGVTPQTTSVHLGISCWRHGSSCS